MVDKSRFKGGFSHAKLFPNNIDAVIYLNLWLVQIVLQ
jgi:hypothetical protein